MIVKVALNRQTHRAANGLEFRQRKVPKLGFKTNNQAKERIASVKFTGVPGPTAVRGKEFDFGQRIQTVRFLTIQLRQYLARLSI